MVLSVFSRLSFGFLVLIALVGCESMPSPLGKPVPEITFKHLTPLALNVRDVDVQTVETHNSAGFSHELDQMVQEYLDRKFVSKGTEDRLVVRLDSSSIKRDFETSKNAAVDLFGLGGFEVYVVALSLRLEHLDEAGNRIYGTVVRAQRQIKISEHASIAEREHAQFVGLEQFFVELDKHVDKVVVQDMKLEMGS